MFNQTALAKFIIFFFLIVLSYAIELVFVRIYNNFTNKKHKTYHFSYAKYLYFAFLPIILSLFYFEDQNINLVSAFIGFSLMGTLTEWLGGFFFHKLMGKRLWTYHLFPIGGHTSFLSLPMWGTVGLVFYPFLQIFIPS